MSVKLEVRDINGKRVREDHLEIYDGDILILQAKEYISEARIDRLISSIKAAFEHRKDHPDQISGVVIPESVTLKILKVIKED